MKGVCAAAAALLLGVVLGSCSSAGADGGRETLRVVSWNVQTFFDARNDGGEYKEFLQSKKWGEAPYRERLSRLCGAIRALDADVFVMEEIENERVLQDISNFLAGEWDSRKWYAHGCFAAAPGGAIGCAVISRWPLGSLTVHAFDVRSERDGMPQMRPLMEFTVSKKGRELACMVCHWKSKSGGDGGAAWRDWQELVLGNRVRMSKLPLLVCGDFNRDIGEFRRGAGAGQIVLRCSAAEDGVPVTSPWFSADGELVSPGSYFFREEWSRIDNFFCAGAAEILSFTPECKGAWCDADSAVPRRYAVWNGSGYSDHLPISCTVRF